MNIINRIKNILITPKTEWVVINREGSTVSSLFIGYVLPLSIAGSAGALLRGLFFTNIPGLKYFILSALIAFIASLVSFYISAIIIDQLAPNFSSEKDLNRSAQLVAYSGTASHIAALLSFIPIGGLLITLAGWLYGIYIMYLGIGLLKKTPEDKKIIYMIASFVSMIAIYFIVVAFLGAILF